MPQPAISLATAPAAKTCLALILGEGEGVSAGFSRLAPEAGEDVKASLTALGFKAARGKTQLLSRPAGTDAVALAVTGGGDLTKLDDAGMETIAASLYHAVKGAGFEGLSFDLSGYAPELVAR